MVSKFSVITLFADMIDAYCRQGVIGRACEQGLMEVNTVSPRDFASGKRANVDDSPYGGGPGMVMSVAPLRAAISYAREMSSAATHVVHLTPQGRPFTHRDMPELARFQHLILIAGRYEGIDERVLESDIDSEWSIGDFVLSGGELPALVMIDALGRFIPGVLGDSRSASEDSFCDNLLDHPHYTRPEEVDGARVPAVLLSGDHAAIAHWRRQQRLRRTLSRRPELLDAANLDTDDLAFLEALRHDPE